MFVHNNEVNRINNSIQYDNDIQKFDAQTDLLLHTFFPNFQNDTMENNRYKWNNTIENMKSLDF